VNESFPTPSEARKRKLRRYIISFVLVFIAVFGIANASPSGVQFATGANSWSSYGWPSAWLRLHTYKTHGFVGDHWEHEFRFEGAQVTSWGACFVSAAVCGTISAALVATPASAQRCYSSFHVSRQ
jgi:hypothetical protein